MKVSCVIVTYNRINTLKKCLECIFDQTYALDQIIVVNNNSSDGTKEYLEFLKNSNRNLVLIHLKENIGGSGGFYEGVKYAYEQNADFIWGMDDDAFAKVDALENLVKFYKEKNTTCCLWSNCNKEKFEGEFKEVSAWMFVGFFLPKEIVSKVGFPRKDFFIYFDDHEYSNRIINNGYKIYKVKNSIIDHNDKPTKDLKILSVGKKKIQIIFPPKQGWRVYYIVRNRILCYRDNRLALFKVLFGPILRYFFKILFSNPKNLKYFFMALQDGICGKAGKRISP